MCVVCFDCEEAKEFLAWWVKEGWGLKQDFVFMLTTEKWESNGRSGRDKELRREDWERGGKERNERSEKKVDGEEEEGG